MEKKVINKKYPLIFFYAKELKILALCSDLPGKLFWVLIFDFFFEKTLWTYITYAHNTHLFT